MTEDLTPAEAAAYIAAIRADLERLSVIAATPMHLLAPAMAECQCGREITDRSPSPDFCSEPCASAWRHHQADPEYPTPREIRDRVEARADSGNLPAFRAAMRTAAADADRQAARQREEARLAALLRDGWAPFGVGDSRAAAVEYRRWCATCRERRSTVKVTPSSGAPWQQCAACDTRWDGILVGEVLHHVDHATLRLNLSDGTRSTRMMLTLVDIEAAQSHVGLDPLIDDTWLQMERRLGENGEADQDRADPTVQGRLSRAARMRAARVWQWRGQPVASATAVQQVEQILDQYSRPQAPTAQQIQEILDHHRRVQRP